MTVTERWYKLREEGKEGFVPFCSTRDEPFKAGDTIPIPESRQAYVVVAVNAEDEAPYAGNLFVALRRVGERGGTTQS